MSDDPRPDPAGADDPAPLDPAAEAAVSDLLGALPDPQLPTDVERRIAAAVAAAGTAPPTVDTPAPDTGQAPPMQPDSDTSPLAARPPSGRWRQPWILQSAAILVIVALIGAVVVGLTSSRGGGDDADAPLVLSQESAGPITASGRTYTAATLADQVRGLVVGETPAGAAAQSADSADESTGTLASTSGDSDLEAVTTLVQDPTTRQECLDQLASVPGAEAVAIDVGRFDGKPAAVIVLPDEEDATLVAAWVVGPTCSTADNPFPYRYERVPRP